MVSLFIITSLFSQNYNKKKVEKVGNLYEMTIYYDNGNIMQHGFLTKDNKLHASWESYNEDGSRKCVATYDNGVKVGIWYYWYSTKKTKVVYKNNKIISVEDLELEN